MFVLWAPFPLSVSDMLLLTGHCPPASLLFLPDPSLLFLFLVLHFLATFLLSCLFPPHFANSSSVLIHAYSFCSSEFCSFSSMSIQPWPLFLMMDDYFMNHSIMVSQILAYYKPNSYLNPLVFTLQHPSPSLVKVILLKVEVNFFLTFCIFSQYMIY